MDLIFEENLNATNYKQAVNVLKKADIILNGPLSGIENDYIKTHISSETLGVDGLDQLRAHATELAGTLFERVVSELLELLDIRPFESQVCFPFFGCI